MHSAVFHGIARGKTIELIDDLRIPDGARIAFTLQAVQPPQEALRIQCDSAAGAWAEFPEMDGIMAAIERGRAPEFQ